MVAIALLAICASCLVQSISAQCLGNTFIADEIALDGGAYGYPGFEAAPYGAYGGLAPGFITPSNGGGFTVTSISPIAITGINVVSENAIEGALAIVGELPFLGAVALEGDLPTGGTGGIHYGCGSDSIGIVSEGLSPYGPAIAPAATMGLGRYGPAAVPNYGYNGILAGCGYNPMY